jgi:hypothetical protein
MVSILKDYAGSNKMIPDYLSEAFKNIPIDVPTSVLMRHSIRFPIESDAEIWTAGLTPEGITLAKNFGTWLKKQHQVERVESSPIGRCVDTGKWLIEGFQNGNSVQPMQVLAHPNENGEYELIDHFLETSIWPDRILNMANYLVPNGHHHHGLNIFISHDTVTITMVAFWLGLDLRGPQEWPRFLEPFFMWWQGEQLIAYFRGESTDVTKVYRERFTYFKTEKNKK